MEAYQSASYVQLRWRAEDVEQRVLDNARVLWNRNVQQNRREVDDRAAQLRNLANLSALVAGFAMSSFLQFNFKNEGLNEGVLLAFGISTALVAALDTCSMAVCVLIQASILRMAEQFVTPEEEAYFIMQCREFSLRYKPGDKPPGMRRSFRNLWNQRCQGEWRRAFVMFSLSVPIFIFNMAVSAWIQFRDDRRSAVAMVVILAVGLLYLTAAHATWVRHVGSSTAQREHAQQLANVDLPAAGLPFDWHLPPEPAATRLEQSPSMSLPLEDDGLDVTPSTASSLNAAEERYRAQAIAQRTLDNARFLWQRFVSRTRAAVGERAEQLRSICFLAGVLDGFAMSSLLQLTFVAEAAGRTATCGFALTLGITVALLTCSMAMCGFITMSILRTGVTLVAGRVEAGFIAQCRAFALGYVRGDRPPAPRRTFAAHWDTRCEAEFRRAFYMFTTGLCVFQANLVFAAWVKFPQPYQATAIAMTIILCLGLLYLVGVNVRWAARLLAPGAPRPEATAQGPAWARSLTPVGLPFDWHLPPVATNLYTQAGGAVGVEPTSLYLASLPPQESPYALAFSAGDAGGRLASGGAFIAASSAGMDGRRASLMHGQSAWREEDQQQQLLDNARVMWSRFVQTNVNDLQEKAESLKAIAELAALIAGFEMIAFLQFALPSPVVWPGVQLAYAITAALTVALSLASMTMCGLVVESILEAASAYVSPVEEAHFIAACRRWCLRYKTSDHPPVPRRNFRNHWDVRCEGEWRRAFTLFSLSVPAFAANASLASWLNWQPYPPPAGVFTALAGAAVLYLLAGRARWVDHLLGRPQAAQAVDTSALQQAGLPFAWHLPPQPGAGSSTLGVHSSRPGRLGGKFPSASFAHLPLAETGSSAGPGGTEQRRTGLAACDSLAAAEAGMADAPAAPATGAGPDAPGGPV